MINIYKTLWIGSEDDLVKSVIDWKQWAVVHACKEPHHRRLLGYTTKAAPKDHKEYLFARRHNELFLNLVDAPKPEFISDKIISEALEFIHLNILAEKNVFVHCNQGESRAPTIGLLYLIWIHYLSGNLEGILKMFQEIYPKYKPGMGMKLYVEQNWRRL